MTKKERDELLREFDFSGWLKSEDAKKFCDGSEVIIRHCDYPAEENEYIFPEKRKDWTSWMRCNPQNVADLLDLMAFLETRK